MTLIPLFAILYPSSAEGSTNDFSVLDWDPPIAQVQIAEINKLI